MNGPSDLADLEQVLCTEVFHSDARVITLVTSDQLTNVAIGISKIDRVSIPMLEEDRLIAVRQSVELCSLLQPSLCLRKGMLV